MSSKKHVTETSAISHAWVGPTMSLRAAARRLLDTGFGIQVKTIEPGALALIDTRKRQADWFSFDLVLQKLFAFNRIDLVLDVGANEGQFARRLRHIFAGEIISFEPVATPFDRLSRAAAGDARWSVHQIALGSVEATATMHVASDTAFSSLLQANAFSRERFRRSVVAARQPVAVKRLDAVLAPVMAARPGTCLFLKLDTQGYDLEAFKGLGRYVENVKILQSELSLIPIYEGMPHWTQSLATYEAAGFAVAGMFPINHDSRGRVIEYDCVLVRRDDRTDATT